MKMMDIKKQSPYYTPPRRLRDELHLSNAEKLSKRPGPRQYMDALRVYSFPVDRASEIICDQHVMLNGFYLQRIIRTIFAAFASTVHRRAKRWSF